MSFLIVVYLGLIWMNGVGWGDKEVYGHMGFVFLIGTHGVCFYRFFGLFLFFSRFVIISPICWTSQTRLKRSHRFSYTLG